jgi:hypothetical protein
MERKLQEEAVAYIVVPSSIHLEGTENKHEKPQSV